MARRTAPDGTKLHSVTVYRGFGEELAGFVGWYDEQGNEWDVSRMHITGAMVSKAHSGKSAAAHGATKARLVNESFEETAEARRVWLRVLAKLRLQDCERILERLKRKNPREGISVSGRDLRDIDLAMVGIFAEMQGESMRRAKPQTATEVFMDALAASRAIDSRF